MMTFLSTLGWGFAGLLAAAVAVAFWEYLRSKTSQRLRASPAEPPGVVSLDVNLDRLPDGAANDQAQRASAMAGALGRMGHPPKDNGPSWIETEPMVAASLKVELPAETPQG